MRIFIFAFFLAFSTTALSQHHTEPDSTFLQNMRSSSSSQEWDIWINEIGAVNNETITDDHDEFEDWIEIYNFGEDPVDLHLAYVTDNPEIPTKHQLIENTPGELIIPPGGFLLLWADDQIEQGATHLNFSLSGSGEYVGIYEPDDTVLVDGIEFPQQISDVSYGRNPEGGDWNYFPTPTPGAANDTEGLFELLPTPVFSNDNAFFAGAADITISVDDPEAEIRFTINGSTPTEESSLYTEPVNFEETTMLRARAFKPDALPSRIATNTFIGEDDFQLDVVSLVTDSAHLWGNAGIYDNRFSGIEKPLHIEYFSAAGELQFEIDGGVKIHAPDTRPQQSLRLFARSEYGDKRIEHQIFEQKDVHWFKRLVLRQAANDGQQLARTHFRDVMAHELFSEMDPDNIYSAYKPVHVYLNGEYWGIYNLRERQDHHFIESNYGFTDIDFLERTATTINTRDQQAGDWVNYDAMRDYLMANDMSDPEHYEVITDWMDIRNYVDYMVTEIWTGNRDWLTNNVKYYRPRNIPETKWKWILWDTEYGMGCYPANDHGNPNFDALHMAMSWGGWPPNWGVQNSTYMMNNLKDNPEFVDYFITRHADLLNSKLKPDNVLEKVDEFVDLYEEDMPKQVDRWGYSMNTWYNSIQSLNNWIGPRASFCRQHIMNKWEHATAEHIINLNVQPEGAGYIKINTIFTDELPWQGYYFEGVPVVLTAVANSGYEFQEWLETGIDTNQLEVWLTGDSTLTALFEVSEILPDQIVINEINYKSAPFLDSGDWIELTNVGENIVSLADWNFRDGNDENIYTFPQGATLAPDEFVILCNSISSFFPVYPAMENVYGPFDFGLSNNGEILRLYNADNVLMDHVNYGITNPWPETPNGQGTTLELTDPSYDNSIPENWFAREIPGGSPGFPNTYITHVGAPSEMDLVVFPNPSDGIFFVHISAPTLPVDVHIFNHLGQMVDHQVYSQNQFSFSLADQPAGIYIARFSSDEGIRSIRLIRQ